MLFHIHTYGCQMNVRDSEAVGALLEARGHTRAPDEEAADIIVVNTCSVRAKAEDKAMGKLGLLCASKRERPHRIVGVMGCMAQRMATELFRTIPALDFVVGTRATALVPEAVERVARGERHVCLVGQADAPQQLSTAIDDHRQPSTDPEQAPRPSLRGGAARTQAPPPSLRGDAARTQALPPSLRGDAPEGQGGVSRADVVTAHEPGAISAFVTILLGCERKCAYCIVPSVRGSEYSRPGADVVREVRAVVEDGARDVTLLGQSVMRYGIRTPVWPEGHESPMGFTEPLPRLFEAIATEVPALRRIRFTSGHPSGVTPELVRAMRDIPALCAHIHLPVQSGSDRVLAVMGRGYTRAGYLEAVARLREAVPDIAITTDVIVGFPGETEEDFQLTRSLLEEAAVDNAFVFKYSPRPGTRSSLWPDDVSPEEKARRNQILLEDQDVRGQRLNDAWIGREVEVLAEGPSLRNAERWAGRSPQNKIVIFAPPSGLRPGDFVRVRIDSAQPQTLYGSV